LTKAKDSYSVMYKLATFVNLIILACEYKSSRRRIS